MISISQRTSMIRAMLGQEALKAIPARQRSFLDEFRFMQLPSGQIDAFYGDEYMGSWRGGPKWENLRSMRDPAKSHADPAKFFGLAKRAGLTRKDFPKRALARGAKVELEHTRSRRLAEQIAMDHLVEDPRYYEKLAKIEKKPMRDPKKLDLAAVEKAAYREVWTRPSPEVRSLSAEKLNAAYHKALEWAIEEEAIALQETKPRRRDALLENAAKHRGRARAYRELAERKGAR